MWRALHIFLHRPAVDVDAFVTDCLAPLVAAGEQRSWFFIRYWSGGPHVRLRLKVEDGSTVDAARAWIDRYLTEHPWDGPPLDPAEHYRSVGAEHHGWYPDGTVVELPYEPETARYGGPDALPVAEELFRRSSEVAVAVLRGTPRRQLVARAVDLTLAVVDGLHLAPTDAAAWLRRYVNAWDFSAEVPPMDSAALRRQAERDFHAGDSMTRGRPARVAATVDNPRSAYGAWAEAVRKADAALAALAEDGRLVGDPSRILASQLHMLHNRLGLSVAQERYLCWLTSLMLLRDGGPGFYGPDAAAVELAYHEHSKYVPGLLEREQMPGLGGKVPGVASPAAGLPLPGDDALLPVALRDALRARNSDHGPYRGTLSHAQLGTVLRWGAGLRGHLEVPTEDGAVLRLARRTYPSAGAKYPVTVQALCYHVDGVEPGRYAYDPGTSSLRRLAPAPDATQLAGASPWFGPLVSRPIDVQDVPAVLVLVADLGRMRAAYGMRGYRFVLAESGHIAQNVVLCAAALGLRAVTVGGFYDDAAAQLVHLDGVEHVVLYLVPLGL